LSFVDDAIPENFFIKLTSRCFYIKEKREKGRFGDKYLYSVAILDLCELLL
jgi:hypothetical protein